MTNAILQGDVRSCLKQLEDVTLAYIAGIIDGEAYIGIKKSTIRKDCATPGYHARIQIRMVDEGAISFIAQALGGNYYKEKPHLVKGRMLYCYQASDAKAATILRSVLPYLRVKKCVAGLVLELRTWQANGRKHQTKIVGHRNFPNSHGTVRQVANKAFSDEYTAECERLYLACKFANRVGIQQEKEVTE